MNTQQFNNLSQAEKNKTLLRYVKNEDTHNIQSALQHSADVNYTTPQGYTPLSESVGTGNEQIVSMLLDAGAEIDVPGDEYNGPPFVWAAKKSDVNIMKLLLEKGGNINIIHTKDGSKDTPLHVASSNKQDDAILFLVDNGADLTIQNKSGQRPLDIFAEKYVEDYEKSISQREETIRVQEQEKEKVQRRMENPNNKDHLKRLESDLRSQQKYLEQSKSYLQPLIADKERGENILKTILEKVLKQKIPLEKISYKLVVKEIYNELMAEVGYKGGKQKKRKTRKSKKSQSKKRKTSKER